MASSQPIPGDPIHDDPQAIFASIYEKFKNALPQDIQKDLASFKDPNDMLENVKKLARDNSSRPSKVRRPLQMIAKIANSLRPYFEVIDIYVQSHPEYAGLVWGTIRFIFTIAANYTTFLGKIEHMLIRMTNSLPNFTMFLEKLHQDDGTIAKKSLPRLAQTLAYIYSDILEFCHRLCRLLHSDQKGIRSRFKLINTMIWKPFDHHFAEIIEKFQLHSELFRDTMQTTSDLLALNFYNRWRNHMTLMESSMKQMQGDQKSQGQTDKRTLDTAVEDLQRRIAAPVWATTFENARSHRADESGEWLLSHPLLTEFTDGNRDTHCRRHANVLFLYGKPGYGKTTLATLVVDHLKDMASMGQNGAGALAFFFFDRQSRFNASHDAFRALLAQLIFCRRFDQIVLDIAAIARPQHDTGQQFASDDEIFAILHLFLLQFGNCSFVCDGIDECKDRDDFLEKLSHLASDHEGCNFFLFTRPVMKIHKGLRHRCEILELDPTQNIEDLRNYVHPKVEELVESGELVLPKATSIDDLVSTISNRANGMFLWAALFLGYLKLPSLSISQRREALEDTDKFEGLYSLYDGILEFIEKEYPRLSRRNIRRALSWVVGAFRPLHVGELQAAVAQMEAKAFHEDDIIPNFTDSIGPMTGALIEVTKDQTVRLIHITVAEYLVSSSVKIAPSFRDENILDFKPAVVQHYLTTTCLAYLYHTVPIGPYVDRYIKDASFDSVLKEYPLFEYSARYWTAHLRGFIQQFASSPLANDLRVSEELGERTTSFLSDKPRFTSWTEALWHLGCPREPWIMESMNWTNFPSISSGNPIRNAASMLQLAYREYQTLVKSWGNILRKYPEEIWQPSISAFSETKLRKESTQAEISSLLPESQTDPDTIVLQTKCSSSGNAIGILLARSQAITQTHDDQSEGYSSRHVWHVASKAPGRRISLLVTYQIRSLNSNELLFETSVDVPKEEVKYIDPDRIQGHLGSRSQAPLENNDEFIIETSISTTLMEVMVGSTLIKLAMRIEASGPQFHSTKHVLQILRDNSGFKRSGPSLWKLFLSPGAEFLLLLRKAASASLGVTSGIDIDIFQDPNCRRRPTKPRFVWVACKVLKVKDETHAEMERDGSDDVRMHAAVSTENLIPNDLDLWKTIVDPRLLARISSSFIDISSDSLAELPGLLPSPKGIRYASEPVLYFHPTLPQIVYSYGSGTYLWNFCSLLHSTVHEVHQEHVQIYDAPLSSIRIADSGNLLYGFENIDGEEKVAVLSLSNYQQVFGKPRVLPSRPLVLDSATSVIQHLGELERAGIARPETSSQVQSDSSAIIVKDTSGAPAISILRQTPRDGSLIQETLNCHGDMTSRTLLHLPSSLAGNTDVTLLGTGKRSSPHEPEHVRVLLGAPSKESYSFKRRSDATTEVSLPAMFERETSSIRVVERGLQRSIENCKPSTGSGLKKSKKPPVSRSFPANEMNRKKRSRSAYETSSQEASSSEADDDETSGDKALDNEADDEELTSNAYKYHDMANDDSDSLFSSVE